MSSTNRSLARQSHVSDYYATPIKPITDLLNSLKNQSEVDLFEDGKLKNSLTILDPCAGGDEKNPMAYPYVLNNFGVNPESIETIDIRDDSNARLKEDFLFYDNNKKFDVIITNPPFNIAEEIINKSFKHVKDNGYVIMLLRLNFFGSKKRKIFWKDNMPILTFVHHERISFTNGQTDSIEYMHCIWKKDVKQDFTKLIII